MKELWLTVSGPKDFQDKWHEQWPTLSSGALKRIADVYGNLYVIGEDQFLRFDVWVEDEDESVKLILHLDRDLLSDGVLDASLSFAECQRAVRGSVAVRAQPFVDEHVRQFSRELSRMPEPLRNVTAERARKIVSGYLKSTIKVFASAKCSNDAEAWSVLRDPISTGLEINNLSGVDVCVPYAFADNYWRFWVVGEDATGIYSRFLSERDIRVCEAAAVKMMNAVQRPGRKEVKLAADALTAAARLATVNQIGTNPDILRGGNVEPFDSDALNQQILKILEAPADKKAQEEKQDNGQQRHEAENH